MHRERREMEGSIREKELLRWEGRTNTMERNLAGREGFARMGFAQTDEADWPTAKLRTTVLDR